jgi:hypothetical protein
MNSSTLDFPFADVPPRIAPASASIGRRAEAAVHPNVDGGEVQAAKPYTIRT